MPMMMMMMLCYVNLSFKEDSDFASGALHSESQEAVQSSKLFRHQMSKDNMPTPQQVLGS